MTVESATYTSGLNPNLPASNDKRHEGDDHIRLIKSTLQNTWANINGAVLAHDEDLNAIEGLGSSGMVSQLRIYRTGFPPTSDPPQPQDPTFDETLVYVYGRNEADNSSMFLADTLADVDFSGSACFRGRMINEGDSGAVAVRGEGYMRPNGVFVAGVQGDVWAFGSTASTAVGISGSVSAHSTNQTLLGARVINVCNTGRTSEFINGGVASDVEPQYAAGYMVQGTTGNYGDANPSFAWDVGFEVNGNCIDNTNGIGFKLESGVGYGLYLGAECASGAIAMNEDNKIIMDLDNGANSYIVFNSNNQRFEFWINSVLEGYLDATNFTAV